MTRPETAAPFESFSTMRPEPAEKGQAASGDGARGARVAKRHGVALSTRTVARPAPSVVPTATALPRATWACGADLRSSVE